MEIKNISFNKGIHRTPSFSESGELSECVNLIPRYGELQNIEPPKEEIALKSGYSLLYVHERNGESGYKKIILKDVSNDLWYADYNTPNSVTKLNLNVDVTAISNIGNTLCIASIDKMRYFLFENDGYTDLGDGTFNLDLAFGIDGEFKTVTGQNKVTVVTTGGDSYRATSYSWVNEHKHYYESSNMWLAEANISVGTRFRLRIDIDLATTVTYKSIEVEYEDGSIAYMLSKKDENASSLYFEFTALKGIKKVNVSFSSGTEGVLVKRSGTLYIDKGTVLNTGEYNNSAYSFYESSENRDALFSVVNSFISKAQRTDNVFMYPFFVRYAIRLTTGDIVSPSAPILIEPNTGVVPLVGIKDFVSKGGSSVVGEMTVTTAAYEGKLYYKALNSSQIDRLKYRSSMVESVVVGVSMPIIRFNQSDNSLLSLTQNCPSNKKFAWSGSGDETLQGQTAFVRLKEKDKTYEQLVLDQLQFRIVKEIKIEDLSSEKTVIDLKEDVTDPEKLATNVSLVKDSVSTLGTYGAKNLFSYNSRLSMANVNESVFKGYNIDCMSGFVPQTGIQSNVHTKVSKNGRDVTMIVGKKSSLSSNRRWVYYPNYDAKAITEYASSETHSYELTSIKSLNGAYHLGSVDGSTSSSSEYEKDENVVVIGCGNRIITSAVDSAQAKELDQYVACREINAVSVATKAISTGQFGEHPIYAFSSDGIWAMSVGTDGKYDSKQPVNRDVLLDNSCVCQLDDAVAYITKEGIKILSGSHAECISTPVHGLNFPETISCFNYFPDSHSSLKIADGQTFVSRLNSGGLKMLFDSPHKLLHVFTGMKLHYVYSLDANEWSMQYLDGVASNVVPGYPLSYLQIASKIYSYDNLCDTETYRKGFILTRPESFGNLMSRKALYDIRLFGQGDDILSESSGKSTRRVVVLLSNDLKNWAKLTSLKGMSAKYYRFLVFTQMLDIDTLSGIAVQYEERYTGKIR